MINSLKTIAFFGCALTSRYRSGLCKCFNKAAKKINANIVYFNSLGKIGEKTLEFSEGEYDLIDYIDLEQFDGIIYDGEGYNVEGAEEKIIKKLRTAKCPVISISTYVDGFYNIEFEDASGMRRLVEHFLDVHKHTKIGFMTGYLSHPDAQLRLKVFREVMKERGLPEDGVGIFEGDFWFHKGEEAADFFLSRPERPQSIVCSNDYMAISLSTALKKRGIRIPEDISVSGYDGSLEGKQFVPHITTATREREDIAEKTMSILAQLMDNGTFSGDNIVSPRILLSQSCGCEKIIYKEEIHTIDEINNNIRYFDNCVNDAQAAILKLNKVEKLDELEHSFRECATNFGDYSAFFLFTQTDTKGRLSCTSEYSVPSDKFVPLIWIDKENEYLRTDKPMRSANMVPQVKSEVPHFYYIMCIYCSERMFGYTLIEMEDDDIFTDFYNIFLLNLSVTIERLWKNDNINKLYEKQKGLYEKQKQISIHDALTGMFNRRGFNDASEYAINNLERKSIVCTMVLDMDGLKHINDVYGHNEGDAAIKAAADIITQCCTSNEIAGRAGGDEFYIYASDYSQEKLDKFNFDLTRLCNEYNASQGKPYKLELSHGAYLIEADKNTRIEDLLKISDARMYKQKMSKPGRQKR
ncbi:diguanylate cyclase (GGDEF) domain-containing protein [Ruminococcus flavefaciens]|uniref:Diguanylate cyclase (GGDEF) domain-containing protein n=2 Tax=Ruminococcus flavefaciens TaxID=1265 RepID=A0A1H6KI43_RUMFL|nr:diguanylate cyclase (GGDEF) domain-containing protein [Ruminococcus flavefaciens]